MSRDCALMPHLRPVIAHSQTIAVNATLTITTTQDEVRYSDLANPAPASQNRWRMPLHRCSSSENVQASSNRQPNQLPQNPAKNIHADSPAAKASNPQVTSSSPAHRKMPVTRCRIDSTIVMRHS